MCPGNGTIQCALELGLAYVLCKWDYLVNGLANVHWKGTSQCTPGMGLSNVPCEWD